MTTINDNHQHQDRLLRKAIGRYHGSLPHTPSDMETDIMRRIATTVKPPAKHRPIWRYAVVAAAAAMLLLIVAIRPTSSEDKPEVAVVKPKATLVKPNVSLAKPKASLVEPKAEVARTAPKKASQPQPTLAQNPAVANQPIKPIKPIEPTKPIKPIEPLKPAKPIEPVHTTPSDPIPAAAEPSAPQSLLAANHDRMLDKMGIYANY